MNKTEYTPKVFPAPLPVILVGSNIEGKANFNVIAYCGIISRNPSIIFISSMQTNYTNKGIHQNNTFSLNIPSADLVQKVDYLGITSGRDVDKSKLFDVFYGELESAPMINECPLNMECKVIDKLNFNKMEVFIGEVVKAYISDDFLIEGKVNVKRIDPLIYSLERKYYNLGDFIADGLSIGKTFKSEIKE